MSRHRHYTPKQVRKTLNKHQRVETDVAVADDMRLRMVEVKDPYVLLDRMISQMERRTQKVERFPYWAELWPASVALARWLCEADLPPPREPVLELGCGLGLVGIALARLGWRVEATDFVEDALVFTSHNAALNRVTGQHHVGYLDWHNPVGPACKCMVAADVLYERKNHPSLRRLLQRMLLPGGRFYTSDPGRQPTQRFVLELKDRGYEHTRHGVDQPWRSQTYSIDIHVFEKPVREGG